MKFFSVLVVFNLACTFAVHREKTFFLCFLSVKFCMYPPFDNLESGKRNDCFGKSGKSPEFWIQKSVQTLFEEVKIGRA